MTKPKISLLPPQGVLLAADVMTRAENPEKYPTPMWPSISATEHVNSAMRHLLAWLSGDLVDEELGTSHLANASCRLLMATAVEHLASEAKQEHVRSAHPAASDVDHEDWRDSPHYQKWLEEADRKYYGVTPQSQPAGVNGFSPPEWDKAARSTKPLWSHNSRTGDTTKTTVGRALYDYATRNQHKDSE